MNADIFETFYDAVLAIVISVGVEDSSAMGS